MKGKKADLPQSIPGRKIFAALIMSLAVLSCAGVDSRLSKKYASTNDISDRVHVYDKVGQQIVNALSSGDADSFNFAINKKTLLHRTFKDMPMDRHVRNARSETESALNQAGIIMTENLGKNARLTFVRTRYMNGEYRALLRVDMGSRGLSYIDFVLAKDETGAVRISDWHDYAQGQMYSESLRQSILFMLPQEKRLITNSMGRSWGDQKNVEHFAELADLSKQKRYVQWMDTYHDMPDELKQSRIMLVTRVLIASAMGSEHEYRAGLKDVSTYLGDDPSLSLLLVDHYLNVRDYMSAHRALDRLTEYTGGDAAIDILQANVYLTEKNYLLSMKYAQRAIKKDSRFEDAYWTLLTMSVYSRDYDTAIDTLCRLEDHFGYTFEPNEIANIKGYEKFANSSSFIDWKYSIRP